MRATPNRKPVHRITRFQLATLALFTGLSLSAPPQQPSQTLLVGHDRRCLSHVLVTPKGARDLEGGHRPFTGNLAPGRPPGPIGLVSPRDATRLQDLIPSVVTDWLH